jgi:hypothetical protein
MHGDLCVTITGSTCVLVAVVTVWLAMQAYSRGLSASQVLGQLSDSDFAASGGLLLPVAASAAAGSPPPLSSGSSLDGDEQGEELGMDGWRGPRVGNVLTLLLLSSLICSKCIFSD